MDIDHVFNEYAEFGYYQKQIFILIAYLQVFLAFHQIHNVFLGAEPDWFCETPSGKRVFKQCPDSNETCTSTEFTHEDFTSIVSEFNLICEERGKANVIQSFFMAGIFCGSLIFGKIADKFGRKPVVSWCATGMAVSSMLGLLALNYWYYCVMRFFTAVFCGGLGLVSFVFLSEMLGQRRRALAGMTVPGFFALGIALFALLAYLLRAWQNLTIFTSIPGFIGLYLLWELPESPRWYYSQGRVEEAQQTLEYIIYRNTGRNPEKPIELERPKVSGYTEGSREASEEGLGSLFRHPYLRMCTFINVFTWFTNCCVYYGLTMGASDLGGSMYLNVALSGLVEIPTYLVTAWLIETRMGRKISFVFSQLLGAVFCGLLIIIPSAFATARIALALAGKISISMSFSIAWLFSAEMYPTSIRNQGVSICTSSARVGGVISPLLMALSAGSAFAFDYATFAVLCLIAGLLATKLQETRGKALPETVAETSLLSEEKIRLLQEEIEANSNVSEDEED